MSLVIFRRARYEELAARSGHHRITDRANALGVDGATIYRLIGGKHVPTLHTVLRIAATYGVAVEDLVALSEKEAQA
ncbi:helix-turn-helix transcriptional regulator [Streptomyces sp. TRM66268-LWL]|uniref:Helix-turn-helix transcriptional regulator n=1 Tax=Streptomyces polyasparticus TaxID=2767826 RepID=A0ABR7SFR1_9ACTN|nr:helix-turn-helix transcriptional regulator [Streptomyces polyasparticus]MBC9714049.1 helix-turn-helix transcriptional regulator [Streptomyces polyasparticus]